LIFYFDDNILFMFVPLIILPVHVQNHPCWISLQSSSWSLFVESVLNLNVCVPEEPLYVDLISGHVSQTARLFEPF
jgi:hypothetical protein